MIAQQFIQAIIKVFIYKQWKKKKSVSKSTLKKVFLSSPIISAATNGRLRKNYFDNDMDDWGMRKENYRDWRKIIQIIKRSKSIQEVLMDKEWYNTAWTFQGVTFSTHNWNHLNKLYFMKLLKTTDDLTDYCEKFIKRKVKEEEILDLSNFKVNKFIKGWLTLKVFYANQKEHILSFHDHNGIAAYNDYKENRLIKTDDFSWGNAICGFGWKGTGVRYTFDKYWLVPYALDTPFSDIERDIAKRNKAQLAGNQATIDSIIKIIES